MRSALSCARHESGGLVHRGVRVGPVVYVSQRVAVYAWWSAARWVYVGRSLSAAVGPLGGLEAGLAEAPPARAVWLRRSFPAVVLVLDSKSSEDANHVG